MFDLAIILQDYSLGRASSIINAIADLSGTSRFTRVRAAVAYATLPGCRSVVERFVARMTGWADIEKRWLLSIDFGRTEPQAIEYLTALPNSEVRISDANRLIERRLVPFRCFHPKTFIFDRPGQIAFFSAFIGSANLTGSGMFSGVEHATAMSWVSPLAGERRSLVRAIRAFLWWEQAWESATPVSAELLRSYRAVRPARPRFPREDSSETIRRFTRQVPREVHIDSGLAWEAARFLWIETAELYKNRGPDRAGNQLDLRRGTRVFFGFPPDTVGRNTVLGSVAIQYDAMRPVNRSVRFGDNSMDKVNLPIPDQDGPDSYDHSALRFERIGAGQFRLIRGTPAQLADWRRRSSAQGMFYELAGGRAFGFYT